MGEPTFSPSRTREGSTDTRLIEFIERKEPNWERVKAWLSRSRDANRWANGGPVSRALEGAIAEVVDLPEARSVVVCSSATAALFALVGAHTYRAGRRLRWVVSASGFFSTGIGPLHEAIVVDCDRGGLLDRQALGTLDSQSYDGVIVTNPFGLHPDWRSFVKLCHDRDKILLYDNAHALFGCDRSQPGAPDEVVSFHHTKPWGMGEGGCAIVSRELEPVVRSMINFGVGLDRRARPLSFNGKVSDLACAFILDRLHTQPVWSDLYHLQEERITALGAEIGLQTLAPLNRYPRNSAALVCERPVSRGDLQGRKLPILKYYQPLAPDATTARWLYDRILNVPCHPGMAAIPAGEIISTLEEIVGPGLV